jgi:IMP dehydrogenase
MIQIALTYDDILFTPLYSDIRSRKEVDLSPSIANWPGTKLTRPIVSSCMDTVTEVKTARKMEEFGGFGIIHRYNTIRRQVALLREHLDQSDKANVSVAVGATGDYLERVHALYEVGARSFCIDVAHGHHILVKEAIAAIRDAYGREVHIIAGNVASSEAAWDLATWGADAIRVGVGGGSICATRIATGHGVPNIYAIEAARAELDAYYAEAGRKVTLIADGGIKTSGDIVKALGLGADMVMLGSMLAATDEAPGNTILGVDGQKYKEYRGMASPEAQNKWRGRVASVEGISSLVKCKGPLSDVLMELDMGIRSGLSYSGARTIAELQTKRVIVQQTSAGAHESSTHILSRA